MLDTKKTTATPADLFRLHTIMEDMQVEFSNAYDTLCHIGELLFDGDKATERYEYDYDHFESMFWLAVHALGRFAGQYDLFMGGSGNQQLENEQKAINDLKALGGLWWKSEPDKGKKGQTREVDFSKYSAVTASASAILAECQSLIEASDLATHHIRKTLYGMIEHANDLILENVCAESE